MKTFFYTIQRGQAVAIALFSLLLAHLSIAYLTGPLSGVEASLPSSTEEEAPLVKEPTPSVDPTQAPFWPSFETVESPQADRFTSELVKMVTILLLVIAGMLVLSSVVKRMMNNRMVQANGSSTIKLMEKRSLSPKSTIYLLEVEGTKLLVGESMAGLHFLTTLPSGTTSVQKSQFETLLERKRDS